MKILLYNPDNGVTRNFMPHLWMFLLKTITPDNHEVLLIDGNVQAMDDKELVRFVREKQIELVGIGAMTRMIAKAYRVADAFRAAGVPVVMGGPHVTVMTEEALGRDGGPRHADAVAIGEADETWPRIVEDAARGELECVYKQVDEAGRECKPSLESYPSIPWERFDLDQFDLVPRVLQPIFKRLGEGWGKFRIIPIETGRGCPYGCEFCTVTGFFGNSIRFRTNGSVVDEMLRLKARVRSEGGQIAVFFVDDNFAINVNRTKSLLRDIIAADAQLPWVAQISINLLKDEELIELITESGGKWIFIGLESIDVTNLADAKKGRNRPDEYGTILTRLAERNIFAITSFIFGMDNDTPGVAERTLKQIRNWPPGLPVFGQLTPYPATPLYTRLRDSGRLDRPKHWMNFSPFAMAHTPLRMSIPQVQVEVKQAWLSSYSPKRNAQAIESIRDKHIGYRILHLIARLFFRGIYFPQMSRWEWIKLITRNRRPIFSLISEGLRLYMSNGRIRTGRR
ncbi:MAG: B12-binding domain-containing radical SAM protein [Candidatus Glassbacteria bacterium]